MPVVVVSFIALGFFVLHAALAAFVPLVEDEAYYALWASAPAWGYYDHPPMIAWWIALGEAVFGRNEFGVRALSVLAFGAVSVLTARIAWLAAGAVAAMWAALLVNATLVVLVTGFVATPDAPSVLFWTAAVWAIFEWARGGRAWWWVAAGLFLGLGVLSKFTNLFLGVGVVLWVLGTGRGRVAIGLWQAWAGAALALAVIAPFVIWNMNNDWAGFPHQFGRIGRGAFNPAFTLEFVVLTVLAVSPLILWLAIKGVTRRETAPLVWLSAPLVAYMVWHSLFNHIPINWLTPLYPVAAVLAGVAAPQAAAWLRRAAAPLGLALGAVPLVYALWHGAPVIAGHNPFNQVRGWPEALAELRASPALAEADWIATSNYGLTGTLWWYLGEDYPVWAVNQPQRYLFRAPFPAELCDRTAVLIQPAERPAIHLENADQADIVTRRIGDTPLYAMRLDTVAGADLCPDQAGAR